VRCQDDAPPTVLATSGTALNLTPGTWYTAKVLVHDDPNNASLQRLRFWVDSDGNSDFSDETTLIDSTAVDDDWPLTRNSGKGGQPLGGKAGDEMVDLLAARPAALEAVLPLPGLLRRLKFLEVNELERAATVRRANLARAVTLEPAAQVVRAAVVVASVVAA